jgi:hypothetical protein
MAASARCGASPDAVARVGCDPRTGRVRRRVDNRRCPRTSLLAGSSVHKRAGSARRGAPLDLHDFHGDLGIGLHRARGRDRAAAAYAAVAAGDVVVFLARWPVCDSRRAAANGLLADGERRVQITRSRGRALLASLRARVGQPRHQGLATADWLRFCPLGLAESARESGAAAPRSPRRRLG